eukprot:3718315-Amphidinium_carterae.1
MNKPCARDASLTCTWDALLGTRVLVKSTRLLAWAVFSTNFWCQVHLNRQFQGSACSNLMAAGSQLRVYTIGLNNFESIRGDRYGELRQIYEANRNISLRDDYEYDALLRVLRRYEPATQHRILSCVNCLTLGDPHHQGDRHQTGCSLQNVRTIDRQEKRGIFLNSAGGLQSLRSSMRSGEKMALLLICKSGRHRSVTIARFVSFLCRNASFEVDIVDLCACEFPYKLATTGCHICQHSAVADYRE